MKRILFLALGALVSILIGCSEELPTAATPGEPDTVTVHDTTMAHDTTTVYDTATVYDTTIVYDTTSLVDTVYLDTCPSSSQLCGAIDSHHKRIAWFVRLQPGDYQFDFYGVTEKDNPSQRVAVSIGGLVRTWPIGQEKDFSVTYSTRANGVWVIIAPEPPPARGHEINVCLVVRRH